ncbi:MAG TPA: hypothetical protein VF121_15195 [Thermoanaerobaculia bacterium]|nr:hypothetical protein [Thermoanaerobaculia bacterium]
MTKRAEGAKTWRPCAGVLRAVWTLALPGAAWGDGELLIDDFEDRDLEARNPLLVYGRRSSSADPAAR